MKLKTKQNKKELDYLNNKNFLNNQNYIKTTKSLYYYSINNSYFNITFYSILFLLFSSILFILLLLPFF
jgi:hypothetical protein